MDHPRICVANSGDDKVVNGLILNKNYYNKKIRAYLCLFVVNIWIVINKLR